MPIHAPNLLLSDGPRTLGLRPQNENLHLKGCSEWVQFPYFLQTNTQHKAGGLNHFPYFLMQESTHEWGGGGRTREGPRGGGGRTIGGGGIFHWGCLMWVVPRGGGCNTSQGGVGEVGLWFG